MRVSKETITKVAEGDTIVGEVIESGGQAEVRIHGAAARNKTPLTIAASDWRAFHAAVKLMDRYVPGKAASDAPPAITQTTPRRNSRGGSMVVALASGARLTVGRNGQTALTRMAARPDHWFAPKELVMGDNGAAACWILANAGLVDRNVPFSGPGKRGQYRINANGIEALAAVKARR